MESTVENIQGQTMLMNCNKQEIRLLELFSGSGQLSDIFIEAGHKALKLDYERKYNPDICCNILDFSMDMLDDFEPNVIFAAPECRTNSTAAMGHHWTGGKCAYIPKTEDAKNSVKVFQKTVDILKKFNGIGWLENPRCLTRKLPMLVDLEKTHKRHTIWHCKYVSQPPIVGEPIRGKPTDIWTNSKTWVPRPVCRNKRPGSDSNLCPHELAPRGAKTGTQGLKNSFERSKYPELLMKEILYACESEISQRFKC